MKPRAKPNVKPNEKPSKKSYAKPHKKSRVKSLLLIALIIVCAGVIALFGLDAYVRASVSERLLSVQEASQLKADCILVLGALVRTNETPSNLLEDRLQRGIELYNLGVSDRLLMSGDHGQVNYDEVNVMKQYAIDTGIPSQHVFMDHAGFSTYESFYRARNVFLARKIEIVTQEYNLYRALYIAAKLGFDAYGVPAAPKSYTGQFSREMREILARAKDVFYTILKPQPTYLGYTIPVNGNGDLTNDKS